MSQHNLPELLRAAALDIRRKPYPISDLIPLLTQAADALSEQGAGEAVATVMKRIKDGEPNYVIQAHEGFDLADNVHAQLFARPQAAQPARVVDAQYPISDYSIDQWWVTEIDSINSSAKTLTDDQFRAVKVAVNFIRLALSTPPTAKEVKTARVVDALRGAIERMDRARSILTGGKPSPECNWGMLDTSDLVGALSTPPAAPTTSQQAGEVTELELFEEWIEQEAGKGALKKWPNEHGTSYENLRVCDYRTGWLAALAAFEAKKAGV